MTQAAPVLLQRSGAGRYLVFNRPDSMNAIDIATGTAFLACCAELVADPEVRAVVLKGAGTHFGVGGDLSTLRGDGNASAMELLEPMHKAIVLLSSLNAPVLASVQGNVFGGSLSMSLACDLAIAADTARFNLAYIKVGASCDAGASWSLPRLVGMRQAMAIALLGDSIDAAEALRLGLINRVVPAADLEQATDLLAEKLAAGPTLAMGRMKRLIRGSSQHTLASQLDLERDEFKASVATADFSEALDAFFSKRAPRFSGV
jgi:2-(1,2-epoxy-1,2-dihydrophenyl)acetyl-CoA isomerase